jgi:TatD DNase family protein
MQWCDIGANLTDKRLDLEPVLSRSLQKNVQQIIITGTSVQGSRNASQIASLYPGKLYSTAGVHPHHAKEFSEHTAMELQEIATSPQVVAIGECGLDFNRNISTAQQQLHAFEQQLQLASELQLPVFLHERDAFETQIQLLRQYRSKLVGAVVHCFTGNKQQMLQYLELDLYIGITGWVCDLKRGVDLREALSALPLNRLLLETDAPYLRPKGLANNRQLDKGNNEPAYLPYIAQQVAQLMETDITRLHQAVQINTHTLFKIDTLGSAAMDADHVD